CDGTLGHRGSKDPPPQEYACRCFEQRRAGQGLALLLAQTCRGHPVLSFQSPLSEGHQQALLSAPIALSPYGIYRWYLDSSGQQVDLEEAWWRTSQCWAQPATPAA